MTKESVKNFSKKILPQRSYRFYDLGMEKSRRRHVTGKLRILPIMILERGILTIILYPVGNDFHYFEVLLQKRIITWAGGVEIWV